MKLVIREYLASLRERGELDAVLPDLLSEMGFTVYSRPARGTRQYGVDIAAVGKGRDGVRRVHLFSVKSGDLDRADWNTSSPQSLRPSLDEILDVYVESRIPPEYAKLPIAICLCFGGDVDEQVRAEVTGYINRNTTERISFEEWNGDRLAETILDGILREELLAAPLRSHLRKSVAMVEEPDIALAHFEALVGELAAKPDDKPADRLARARLVNICLWIMFVWAREANNVEAPYRASEVAILNVWNILKADLGKTSKASEQAGLVFNELVVLHQTIWDELYTKKILPYADDRHAVSTAIGSHTPLDVNLKLFDTLGRLALRGAWLVWLGSGNHLPMPLDEGAVEVDEIDLLCDQILAIIGNNRALLSPVGDWQAIDIALALTLLGTRRRFWPTLAEWVETLADNSIFAFRTQGVYPTTRRSYWDLVDHPAERTTTYRQEATEGSILYPLLALWATALGAQKVVDEIAVFHADDMAWCNFQAWLPDEDSETLLYLGDENHGATLSHIPVMVGTRETFNFIMMECAANTHFDRLSAVKLGHWPVLLTACRYHRLPVPPQLWRVLLPAMMHETTPKQSANDHSDGGAAESLARTAQEPIPWLRAARRRVPRARRKKVLHFNTSRTALGAGIAAMLLPEQITQTTLDVPPVPKSALHKRGTGRDR